MSKATTAPKCMVCGSNHWLRDPHKWADEPSLDDMVAKVMGKAKERVHKPKKAAPKRVHKEPERVHKTPIKDTKPIDVYTRQVNTRKLRANMATELKDLPFDIISRGVVIARVVKVV